MILQIQNSLTQQQGIQQTYLGSTVIPGNTSAPIRNGAGFNTNWAVQIGQTGEETAEILNNSSISGTQMNFGTAPSNPGGTILFAHDLDTPMYQIHYDQVIVNRSTTGTGGPFSAFGTTNITPDSQYTNFNDPNGAATYAYYTQWYNSLSGDLSGSSSIFVPGGPTFYSLQAIRQRTKDKLYSAGYIRDDTIITSWINEAYELMANAAIKVNQNYLLGTNQFAFGTSGLGTITDSFFKQPIKLEVSYDGVTYIPSRKIEVRDYSELDFHDINAPRHAWLGETVFQILPHQQAGTVKMTYAQRFTPLVNDSDELTQTLKAYTTAFTEYCLGVAYGLDQKDAESQQHYQLFGQGKGDFVAEITPRDLTGAEMIDISESLSGADDDMAHSFGDWVW